MSTHLRSSRLWLTVVFFWQLLVCQPPICRLAFWILVFLLRLLSHEESDVGSPGSEIGNDSGDRLLIPQVTFVGSAYTASTHLQVDSGHLSWWFRLEAY